MKSNASDLPNLPEPGSPQTVLFTLIRRRLLLTPFKPFRVVTTSGRAYDVPTADHAGVSPLLRIVHIARNDCSLTDIHALHIAAVEDLRRHRRRAA